MTKLIMEIGVPGSGKSTHARQLVSGGDWSRVNKDDIRQMIHPGKDWKAKDEKFVMKAEIEMVRALLGSHRNVVVDDTNLRSKDEERWKGVAKEFGAKFETKRHDIHLNECIDRVITRNAGTSQSPVPVHRIIEMARQANSQGAFPFVHEILVDIDGTLADIEHRRHHVRQEKKNWTAFFAEMGDDRFRQEVWSQVQKEKGNHRECGVILVSARNESHRDQTERWLRRNGLFGGHEYFTLFMRRDGDSREDSLVKQEILDTFFKKERIVKVFDDRPRVLRMWANNGLRTVDVGTGEEF